MKYVIGFIGRAGSGKDASATILGTYFENKSLTTEKFAFADKLKEECRSLGWDGEKDLKGRTMLQHLGDVMREYKGPSYYADIVANKICESSADVIFVTDVRFISEAEALNELDGEDCKVYLIRLIKSTGGWHRDLTKAQMAHASESEMDSITVDYAVMNNGTFAELKETLLNLEVVRAVLSSKGKMPDQFLSVVTERNLGDNQTGYYLDVVDRGKATRTASFCSAEAAELTKEMITKLMTTTPSRDIPLEPTNQETPTPEYDNFPETYGKCPVCGCDVYDSQKYCDQCGQRIIWK